MKNKFLVLLMAAAIAAGASAVAFAEDVFVTRSGTKYHHAESPFIKNRETTKMSKEEAEAKGYEPSKSYLKAKAKEASAQEQKK